MMDTKFWNYVRSEIIGRSTQIDTPFGKRLLTYADYTASGRGVRFIERYLEKIQEHYGNTHTEDDITGSLTTERMHWAEKVIKAHVKAGKEYRIIEAGTGSTGAIHRLQQIIGLYIPPAAKELISSILFRGISANSLTEVETTLLAARPVVFVGPYEHHSNEISWRECFAEVIEVDLCEDGTLDMADLEKKVSAPVYAGRLKIGSFSAGSNVSGIKTPVYEVARVLKRHDCLVFFDFAATGPYVDINMCKSEDTAFDAIFFSPHKFLGGPGSTGILIIHEKIYPKHLPPTCAGGGTVDFVNQTEQAYSTDIETREKPGTPGILQTMKAALALELKDRLGVEEIEKRETDYIRRGLEFFAQIPEIEVVGNPDPSKRVAILSFNITTGDCYLHPRYVVRLLNDLFGIQSRAGCSCAGPYGHRLLKIDNKKSLEFKEQIMMGNMGIKPGWARLNFHYIATEEEFQFILQAVAFAAENGKTFLPLYHFDQTSGGWYPRDWKSNLPQFGLEEALSGTPTEKPLTEEAMGRLYTAYLEEAETLAEKFRGMYKDRKFETTERNLIPFVYCP